MSAADHVHGNDFALGCVATGLALSAASLGVAVWRSQSFAANLRLTERYGSGSPFEFTLIAGIGVIFCIACAALVFRPDLSDSERFRFGIGVALFGFLAVVGIVAVRSTRRRREPAARTRAVLLAVLAVLLGLMAWIERAFLGQVLLGAAALASIWASAAVLSAERRSRRRADADDLG